MFFFKASTGERNKNNEYYVSNAHVKARKTLLNEISFDSLQ